MIQQNRNRRFSFKKMFLLLTLLTILPAFAEEPLKIVVNSGIAPFKFNDNTDQAIGLIPDIWELWSEKTGIEIQFISVDLLKESLIILNNEKADFHGGLFKSDQLELTLDYSEPILEVEYFIFTHPDLKPIETLDEVRGILFGIVEGGFEEEFVRGRVNSDYLAVYSNYNDLFYLGICFKCF